MGENREPNWVDYGNLAANVVQVGQLVAVNRRLSQLQQIEADREERARLLRQMRQMVFDTEDDLERMTQYITRAPRGVYAAMQVLTQIYDEYKIMPQTYEEFADKDRVKKIRQAMQSLKDSATCELSEAQRAEIDQKIALSYHINELETLIQTQQTREELKQTEPEWQALEKEYAQKVKPWSLKAWLSIGAALIGLILSCVIPPLTGNLFENLFPKAHIGGAVMTISTVISIGLFVLAPGITFIICMVKRSQAMPKGYNPLKTRRNLLIGSLIPQAKFLEMAPVFGEEKTSHEYILIRDELKRYMQELITLDRDRLPLPEGALQITFESA